MVPWICELWTSVPSFSTSSEENFSEGKITGTLFVQCCDGGFPSSSLKLRAGAHRGGERTIAVLGINDPPRPSIKTSVSLAVRPPADPKVHQKKKKKRKILRVLFVLS